MAPDIVYADLHVHLGASDDGSLVKVTAARSLTVANIAAECVERKGIGMIGLVDAHSPRVIADVRRLIAAGEAEEVRGGGIRYRDRLTLILGSEVETGERDGCSAHQLAFFRDLTAISDFSRALSHHVSNIDLSTQRCRLDATGLAGLVASLGGLLIPAHVFTPHKGIYGSCTTSLSECFPPQALAAIPALELGLSADTELAEQIPETARFAFVSNSDAHSLPKIGREYNAIRLNDATFDDLAAALWQRDGLAVVGNYGLDPRLGKYHRTFCDACGWQAAGEPPEMACPRCGGPVTRGVLDRIAEIALSAGATGRRSPAAAPGASSRHAPYYHHVPLEYIPGVGPRAHARLLSAFGTEMAVLHRASESELADVVGAKVAHSIILGRSGRLRLSPGGGGHYGRVID
ncbi:MAG: endonuclease Q family protein [Chloroflexota bacterium]